MKEVEEVAETEENKHWYAVYTGSRKEKYVCQILSRKQVRTYLPLQSKTRRYASKIKTYHTPLITCYVFVFVSSEEMLKVLKTEYVYNFVKRAGKPSVIDEEDINRMKRVVGEMDEIGVVALKDFEVGERVELLAGNLTGLQGEIIQTKGSTKFLVRLESVEMGLVVEVDESKLYKIIK